MAEHRYQLSNETQQSLKDAEAAARAAQTALENETQTHRDEWSARSEKWQDGEKGQAADNWFESLDEIIEALESAAEFIDSYSPEA